MLTDKKKTVTTIAYTHATANNHYQFIRLIVLLLLHLLVIIVDLIPYVDLCVCAVPRLIFPIVLRFVSVR